MSRREFSEDWSSFFDPSTRVRRGLCPVTGKGSVTESHSLYFEQHGSGPEKIVFIMGLNTTSFSWGPQVNYFSKIEKYSVLVFDNRGVGYSDAPRGPYTTSGMAEDVMMLLDHVGWSSGRDLHIVGISLGGMVAQELAYRIPHRIVSLMLSVTTAGGRPWNNVPPWKGFSFLCKLLITKDPKVAIRLALESVFPIEWLNLKDEEDPEGRTNREVKYEEWVKRGSVTRKQTLLGMVSQMTAGLTHRVTPDRLRTISKSIPKIVILVGDEDNLVDFRNSYYLKQKMPEAELVVWEKTGHGLHAQWPARYCQLLERMFEEGKAGVAKGDVKDAT